MQFVSKGKYKVKGNLLTLYDPKGKIETTEAEIKGDKVLLKIPVKEGNSKPTVEDVYIKAQNAKAIQKIKDDTLWSRYHHQQQENSSLTFDRDGTVEGSVPIGNWMIYPGIICRLDNGPEWKLVKREGELIWPSLKTRTDEKTSSFGGDLIWVKCKNADCGAEYQIGKTDYFKYVQQNIDPLESSAPPLVCQKCSQKSVFRAEKCPSCGKVFFYGAAGAGRLSHS